MIITAEDRSDGHIAIRKMLSLLKGGESILVYPGGELEPDPALFPGSSNLLRDWSRSISLVLSQMPDTILQPVILRGTISQQAWKNRLASMARSATTRLQIAMILQIVVQQLKLGTYPLATTLIKGPPLKARDLSGNLNPDTIQQGLMAVINEMVRSDPLNYPLLEEIIPAM